MASGRHSHRKGKGKRPFRSLRPKARKEVGHDTSTCESDDEQPRFLRTKVLPGRDIDFEQLKPLRLYELFARLGWVSAVTCREPVYPSLVRLFYSNLRYSLGGCITSTVRGVKIEFDADTLCKILDIPVHGRRVLDTLSWPYVEDFDPVQAMRRLYGSHTGKLSAAASLTLKSRLLHHMLFFIILPRGGRGDRVTYYEAFLVDCILTGRKVHLGHIIVDHMISCFDSKARVLPYGRFLTRVFRDAGVDLTEEKFELPRLNDTYNEKSLIRMKFKRQLDGSWVRKAGAAPPPKVEEVGIQDMGRASLDPRGGYKYREADANMGLGTSSQQPPSIMGFTGLPQTNSTHPELLPLSSLSEDLFLFIATQLNSVGTRIRDLAESNVRYFCSVEDGMDQYQTGFKSQYEQMKVEMEDILAKLTEIQGQLERQQDQFRQFEERSMHRHKELMAYLGSVFPSPPPTSQ